MIDYDPKAGAMTLNTILIWLGLRAEPYVQGTCQSCKFWSYECRRHPPRAYYKDGRNGGHGRVYPQTSPTDWCGEYRRREFKPRSQPPD